MTRIISTTEKTATAVVTCIGVDRGKDDHSVEVIGRLRADGSIEVIGFRHLPQKRRQGAAK